jgi:predicted dehydrogenase
MKVLIVGMGFGNLYKSVHTDLGNTIITVDTQREADFKNIEDAIRTHGNFDMAHICTPNFTHIKLARQVAPVTGIVIIEKPGAATKDSWEQIVRDYPRTRFMMSKNNMWRDNIRDMQHYASHADVVRINWINKDRVPNPGTWFTTQSLAYGGVSRDLMPHLLSLYIALNPNWRTDSMTASSTKQNWRLEDLTQTDYGTVDANGTYNVDDFAKINFTDRWVLTTNWRDTIADRQNIECVMPGDKMEAFTLGLCPESAYKTMVQDAINNIDNNEFWANQYEQDLWIHSIIDKLCE